MSNLNKLNEVIEQIPASRRTEAESFFVGYIASDIPENVLQAALEALRQRFHLPKQITGI